MRNHGLFLAAIALLTILPLACGGGGGSEEASAPAAEESPAAAPSGGVAPDLSQAGSITGKVNFTGEAPKAPRIRMGAEPECEHKHASPVVSEEVMVNEDGTLQNVFVWVKTGLEQYKFDPPAQAATLDQEGCVYKPHVFGVQANQEINIVNSDPITHNIHPVPQNNREWNISQSPNQEIAKSFARPEIMIPVKCNVHPWMKSYIGVVAHPYFAVTGTDGSFTIENLPPGDYTVEAWHEKFGTQETQVTVGPNESKEIEFGYQG